MINDIDRISMAFQSGRISMSQAYWKLISLGYVDKEWAQDLILIWNKESKDERLRTY